MPLIPPASVTRLRQWAGLSCMLVGVVFGVFISAGGCSSPEQRYKTLSFFFDGVPDPAKKIAAAQANTRPDHGPSVILASIVSRHKPYVEAGADPAKCDLCHRSASGNIQDFDEAYKLCTQCHQDVPKKLPRMHGPVAIADCKWCHTAHESPQPHLLKDNAIAVCTQCHDAQLLGSRPPEHNDGKTSCIQCHFGHGGTERNYLKPLAAPHWPATSASQPTTTTQPRTLNLPRDEGDK